MAGTPRRKPGRVKLRGRTARRQEQRAFRRICRKYRLTDKHDPFAPWRWLIGRACWGVAAGRGTGTQASLHFGRKVRRIRELDNPKLQPDLRAHEGEVILFIECKWSMRTGDRLLFDSDVDIDDARMAQTLQRLVGRSVSEIKPSFPPKELSLLFGDDIRLDVQADRPSRTDPHDNYTLIAPHHCYIIGPDLRLRVQARQGVPKALSATSAAGVRRTVGQARVRKVS